MKSKPWIIAYLVITQVPGALILLLWPFMLLASVMGLAGHRTGNEPLFAIIIACAFFIWTIIYPLPFAVFSGLSWVAAAKDQAILAILLTSLTPGISVLLIGVFFHVSPG